MFRLAGETQRDLRYSLFTEARMEAPRATRSGWPRVFVGSTHEAVRLELGALPTALLRLNVEIVAAENFIPRGGPEPSGSVVRQDLEQLFRTVDVALFIFDRHGPFLREGNATALPLEVELAREANVRTFFYLREGMEIESDPNLLSLVPVSYYKDATELASLVTADLTRFLDEHSNSSESAKIPFNTAQQYQLPPGLRDLLARAAALAGGASPEIAANTSLVFIQFVEEGVPGARTQWAADFLRQQVAPVYDAYTADREQYLTEKGIRLVVPEPPGPSKFMSQGLAHVLERAQEIAILTTGSREIHGRHLLAALLEPGPNDRKHGAQKRIEAVGLSVPLLRERLLRWLRGYGDRDEVWQEILRGEHGDTVPLSEFDSDQVRGDNRPEFDFIDIGPEVTAFSTLIAARVVTPPLSIGLVGEWGSGKTFFMRRLRHEVANLATQARKSGEPQKNQDFYKHIIQIEFNAWHYVEGNLWASLVEHIFDNLSIFGKERPDIVAQMQEHWLGKLEFETEARAAASKKAKVAKTRVNVAGEKLKAAEEKHKLKTERLSQLSKQAAERAFVLSGAAQRIQGVARSLGLQQVHNAATELQSSLNQARAVVERGVVVLTPLIRADDRASRWGWLIMLLFAAPALAWLAALVVKGLGEGRIETITTYVTAAAGFLGLAARWVQSQAGWVSKTVEKIEAAQTEYDKELAAKQAETAEQIAKVGQELALAREEYSAARREVDEANRRVAEAQKELAQATAGRLLAHFVQDRASSSDYRQHLGVLALVRNDFEKLSRFIETENTRLMALDSVEEEGEGESTRMNRIVLYIDDLDRCPPAKVVDVLQAVHLLLAFPLFVVVVGVDARWVAKSLETRYRELLHAGDQEAKTELNRIFGVATTEDYLEKIFQIPFWVQPLDIQSSQRMLRRLVLKDQSTPRASADPDPPTAPKEPAQTADPRERDQAAVGSQIDDRNLVPMRVADSEATRPQSESGGRKAGPATVVNLNIGSAELHAMNSLAPILGRSPRALKRFVNTYRVIKASLPPAERADFMRTSEGRVSDFEVVLFLLAVVTGRPQIAPYVFNTILQPGDALTDTPPEETSTTDDTASPAKFAPLVSGFEKKHPSMRDHPQWIVLKQWLLQQNLDALVQGIQRADKWIPRVARFSFDPLGDEFGLTPPSATPRHV